MSPDMWTDDHTPMMGKFFTDPDTRLLVVYIDKVAVLSVTEDHHLIYDLITDT